MASSLSLPPLNYLIINFLTFSLFFLFLIKKSNQHKRTKLFFLYGWLFGFGYFVSSLYWISISLTFDSQLKVLIPISIILIPSFLALFIALPVFLLFYFLKLNNLILIVARECCYNLYSRIWYDDVSYFQYYWLRIDLISYI